MTPRTGSHWVLLSVGFPRQEYCSGLPFPSPGDLPDPGMEPTSPAVAGEFFITEPPGKRAGRVAIKKQDLVSDGLGTEAGPTWLPRPLHLLDQEFGPNLPMTRGPAAEAGRGCGSHRSGQGGRGPAQTAGPSPGPRSLLRVASRLHVRVTPSSSKPSSPVRGPREPGRGGS